MNNVTGQPTGVVTAAAAANYAYNQYIERLPNNLMRKEWEQYAELAGGANNWAFLPIAAATKKRAVKMNPDVLYSVLSYDVTEKPLQLSVPVSRDPFWSLTLFQENADSFMAIDDRAVDGDLCELIILGPNQVAPAGQSVRVVASPSNTGIVVVCCVLPHGDAFKQLDKLRRGAKATLVEA